MSRQEQVAILQYWHDVIDIVHFYTVTSMTIVPRIIGDGIRARLSGVVTSFFVISGLPLLRCLLAN